LSYAFDIFLKTSGQICNIILITDTDNYRQVKMEQKFRKLTELVNKNDDGRMISMLEPQFHSCDEENMTAEFRFEMKEWEQNPRGEVHGGAATTMFDTAMGMTIIAFMDCESVSTADLNVSFIRPFTGNSFIFRCEILHPGRTLVRIRATAHDEQTGKTLASSTANFVYKKRG